MNVYRPIVGITLGDPAGIGPEIIVRSLTSDEIYNASRPLVIGSVDPLKKALEVCNIPYRLHPVQSPEEGRYEMGTIDVLDCGVSLDGLTIGTVQKTSGEASVAYIKRAVELLLNGRIDATASGPNHKEAIRLAGYKYPGVTEMLADMAGAKQVFTLLVVGPMRIFQVTTHVSLREALELLTYERIFSYICHAHDVLSQLEKEKPRLAVAGLNPHAGENGLMGREEIEVISPAIEAARQKGILVSGPIPADSIMIRGLRNEFSGLIFLYHDQANIGIKLLAEQYPPVTVAVGLPFVRTTVAHGTAHDIAYKGIANYKPMHKAILLAAELALKRRAGSAGA